MIVLFDNKIIEYGKCNGILIVLENIVDVGGFLCVLEAVMFNKENDIKDFFISFVVIWKSKYKFESVKLLFVIDVYVFVKLRVNI